MLYVCTSFVRESRLQERRAIFSFFARFDPDVIPSGVRRALRPHSNDWVVRISVSHHVDYTSIIFRFHLELFRYHGAHVPEGFSLPLDSLDGLAPFCILPSVGEHISLATFHKYSADFKLGRGGPISPFLTSCITLASPHRCAISSSVRGNGGAYPKIVQCNTHPCKNVPDGLGWKLSYGSNNPSHNSRSSSCTRKYAVPTGAILGAAIDPSRTGRPDRSVSTYDATPSRTRS